MKKLFLAALAATMMSAPVASVQAAPRVPAIQADAAVQLVNHRPNQRTVKRVVIKRDRYGRVIQKKVVVQKKAGRKHWQRGHRMDGWNRHRAVDYKRYHLRRPAHNQRWVRADNDFLLITIGTGLIASIIAAH